MSSGVGVRCLRADLSQGLGVSYISVAYCAIMTPSDRQGLMGLEVRTTMDGTGSSSIQNDEEVSLYGSS